jgi:hypothetical protein
MYGRPLEACFGYGEIIVLVVQRDDIDKNLADRQLPPCRRVPSINAAIGLRAAAFRALTMARGGRC